MSKSSRQKIKYPIKLARGLVPLLGAIVLVGCASSSNGAPDQSRRAGAGGAAGFSGTASRPISLLMSEFDADRDRRITEAELSAGIAKEWGAMEAAGSTTPLAYKSWQVAALGSEEALPAFLSFDRNLNNELSADEFEQHMRQEFSELDRDNDGVLTRAELTFTLRRPQGGQGQGTRGGQGARGQGGRGRGGGRGGRGGGRGR